jgi:hypothetical protein
VGDLEHYKLAEGLFRDWLHRGMTGCGFAAMLAATKPVRIDFYSPLGKLDHEQIAAFVDGVAERKMTAILLFPHLRTAKDVAGLLRELGRAPRWKLHRSRWPKGRRKPDAVALSLDWTTKAGAVCDAMGLGPFGTMPVTRRAPYVAIVLWSGPHLNPHIREGKHVGVASAPTGLKKRAHRKLMKASDKRVGELLAIPPGEDATWLRGVAFVLPKAAAMGALNPSAGIRATR